MYDTIQKNNDLEAIKNNIKNAHSKLSIIIYKMQRDILGIKKLLQYISDVNDADLVFPKDSIENLLLVYLNNQLAFLKTACDNEISKEVSDVKNNLFNSEYATSTYNIKNDVPFWDLTAMYYLGNDIQGFLTEVHNTLLSENTSIAFLKYLNYKNILTKYGIIDSDTQFLYYTLGENAKKEIFLAKNEFINALNDAIVSLYDLYNYINILVNTIIKNKRFTLGNAKMNVIEYFNLKSIQTSINTQASDIEEVLIQDARILK